MTSALTSNPTGIEGLFTSNVRLRLGNDAADNACVLMSSYHAREMIGRSVNQIECDSINARRQYEGALTVNR